MLTLLITSIFYHKCKRYSNKKKSFIWQWPENSHWSNWVCHDIILTEYMNSFQWNCYNQHMNFFFLFSFVLIIILIMWNFGNERFMHVLQLFDQRHLCTIIFIFYFSKKKKTGKTILNKWLKWIKLLLLRF